MVNKKLKKFHFIKKNSIFEFGETNNLYEDLMVANGSTLTYTDYPVWTVTDGIATTMSVDVNGNINTLGQIRALGSVMFNTETRRLNYWDGDQWIEVYQ